MSYVGIYAQQYKRPEPDYVWNPTLPPPDLQWDASKINTLLLPSETAVVRQGDPVQYWDEVSIPPFGQNKQRLTANNALSTVHVDTQGYRGVKNRGLFVPSHERNDLYGAMVFIVFQRLISYTGFSLCNTDSTRASDSHISMSERLADGNINAGYDFQYCQTGTSGGGGSLYLNERSVCAFQLSGDPSNDIFSCVDIYPQSRQGGGITTFDYGVLFNVYRPRPIREPGNIYFGRSYHKTLTDPENAIPAGQTPLILHDILFYRSAGRQSPVVMTQIIQGLEVKWNINRKIAPA